MLSNQQGQTFKKKYWVSVKKEQFITKNAQIDFLPNYIYGFIGPAGEIMWFTAFLSLSFHAVKVTAKHISQTLLLSSSLAILQVQCPTRSHLPWHWFPLASNFPDKCRCSRENPGLGGARAESSLTFTHCGTYTCNSPSKTQFSHLWKGYGRWEWGSNALSCTLTGNTCTAEGLLLLGGGHGASPEGEPDDPSRLL